MRKTPKNRNPILAAELNQLFENAANDTESWDRIIKKLPGLSNLYSSTTEIYLEKAKIICKNLCAELSDQKFNDNM